MRLPGALLPPCKHIGTAHHLLQALLFDGSEARAAATHKLLLARGLGRLPLLALVFRRDHSR